MLGLCCCGSLFLVAIKWASHCGGFSCCGPWALGAWASVVVAGGPRVQSVVVTQGLSCPTACGILPDQGSNPHPLYWQVNF